MSLEETLISISEDSFAFNESGERQSSASAEGAFMWHAGIGIAAVYAMLIAVGLLGNVTLILVFCSVKSMRNVPNIFLCSLAFGDLLLLVTCAPVDASRYLADQWLFGRAGCKLIPFIQLTSVGVCVFTLTVLAADRYKAIVKPMDNPTSHAMTKICLRASAIWLVSMVLAIPEAVFSDLHTFNIKHTNESFKTCAPYPHTGDLHPKIHSMAFFLIFYVIPLSIISVYYFFIARSLIRSVINIPVEEKIPIRKQMESRKRLAKIILVFVGLFAICWLPSHVIYLYRSYHYTEIDTSMIHFIASVTARILAFTNSCVNPFALYLLSKSFQKQFNKKLCCCCCPPPTMHQQSVSRVNTCMSSLRSIQNHTAVSLSPINGNH